jgi:hypothetical protein
VYSGIASLLSPRPWLLTSTSPRSIVSVSGTTNLLFPHTQSISIYYSPFWVSSWPWSYGSWIYNYLCNQCLSPVTPLTLWVRIKLRRGVLDTTLCGDLRGTPVSSTNKIDHNDIDEILLKMALNTIILTPISNFDFNSTFL